MKADQDSFRARTTQPDKGKANSQNRKMAVRPEKLRSTADRNVDSLQVEFEDLIRRALGLTSARNLGLEQGLTSAGNLDLVSPNSRARARSLAGELTRDLERELTRDLDPARDMRRQIESPRAIASARNRATALARDLQRKSDTARVSSLDRSGELAASLNRLAGDNSQVTVFQLYSIVGSVIDVLLGVPYSPGPTPPSDNSEDLVELEVNDHPAQQKVAAFTARLEPVIRDIELALSEGRFDTNREKRRQVERDISYLRAEVYETGPEDFLGEALGAIVARLGRELASVTDIPSKAAPVIDALLRVMSSDQPDQIPEVIQAVLDNSSIDDPEWLAAQDQTNIVAEIREEGPTRWFARVLGWIDSDHFGSDVGVIRNSGAVALILGSAIGFVVSAFMNSVAAAGAAASIGGLVGVGLGWIAVRYRNRSQASCDV